MSTCSAEDFYLRRDYESALEQLLKKLRKGMFEDYYDAFLAGSCKLELREYLAADEYFSQVIERSRHDEMDEVIISSYGLRARSRIFRKNPRYDLAMKDLSFYVRVKKPLEKRDSAFLKSLGDCQREQKEPKKAIKSYELALNLIGEDSELSFRIGHVYHIHLEKLDEALPHYDTSIRFDESNWRARTNRAYIHFQKKDYESAMNDIEKLFLMDPKPPNHLKVMKLKDLVEERMKPKESIRKSPKIRCKFCPAKVELDFVENEVRHICQGVSKTFYFPGEDSEVQYQSYSLDKVGFRHQTKTKGKHSTQIESIKEHGIKCKGCGMVVQSTKGSIERKQKSKTIGGVKKIVDSVTITMVDRN